MLEPKVVYQDADVWVINKPPGWVVNAADSTDAPTIQAWWQAQRPSEWPSDWQSQVPADFPYEFGTPEEIFEQRQGIAHRLDKDTSGVLVLAVHPGSLAHVLAQFRLRTTHKTYLALAHGKWQIPSGIIDLPLGRASKDRTMFAVRPDGRSAQTKYRVTKNYSGIDVERVYQEQKSPAMTLTAFRKEVTSLYQGFSLVECEPLTGRTHQIRVHLAHLKHPLVGDQTYLGRKRRALDPLWCPRHFLHAAKLQFLHPRTNETLSVEAPLPDDLQQVLLLLTD